MPDIQTPHGVFAAALTPLKPDYSPDLQAVPGLLEFLSRRGCHGALLFGTTGEGPSFSPSTRLSVIQVALEWRSSHPDFQLLAGTGTPSLEETIVLTDACFDLGIDGVVVLPPYYFRKVNDDGLFAWFSALIRQSVPRGLPLLGYHIPAISGVSLSLDLLARLKDAFPRQFAGIKDSSGEAEHARHLGERFGADLAIFTGNDRLFGLALHQQASGCITALANLFSPDLRLLWDYFWQGEIDPHTQARLDAARDIMDAYPPAPPLLKALLARRYHLPRWPVCPPLLPMAEPTLDQAAAQMDTLWHA